MRSFPEKGLYAITDPSAHHSMPECLEVIEDCLKAGVAVLQLRDKAKAIDAMSALAIRELCHHYQTPFIVNDDISRAKSLGADGVHLGKTDQSFIEARNTLGSDAIIGISCYGSIETAEKAATAGASYIAFGSFFPSSTKPNAPACPVDVLKHRKWSIPVVAIGGITPENGSMLLEAGADFLAVISGIFRQTSPAEEVARYCQLFKAA